MKYLLACLLGLMAFGCNTSSPPASPGLPPATAMRKAGAPPVGGAGIAPMGTPAVGGLTPVGNTDSVEGAGSGSVGQAAKNQARRAAAMDAASSASQSSGE